MDPQSYFERYRELQQYVGWTEEDARRVRDAGAVLQPHFSEVIDDFYAEIEQHPDARQAITGGREQIERLKGTLRCWLEDLFAGPYNAAFVARRFRVGLKHVEIGLPQFYTNVALSRIRTNLLQLLAENWEGDASTLWITAESLNKVLDLDLAMIEAAYQAEYVEREQRQDRLATIGQIAGGVAHELRNPLNAVKTSVYYLLHAKNPSPEKMARHLERIDRQIGLADGVVQTLSDFARMPLPCLEPIALGDCIRESLQAQTLPESIEIVVDCPAALPQALGDASQLQIVLGNLIRNARDAMPDGGRLSLAAHDHDGYLEIDVTDTGTGIPEEEQTRIMQPLYSTKSRGIGLGLALSRMILEKHDGELRFESEPGWGTTFTVTLPRAPQ